MEEAVTVVTEDLLKVHLLPSVVAKMVKHQRKVCVADYMQSYAVCQRVYCAMGNNDPLPRLQDLAGTPPPNQAIQLSAAASAAADNGYED